MLCTAVILYNFMSFLPSSKKMKLMMMREREHETHTQYIVRGMIINWKSRPIHHHPNDLATLKRKIIK
jgi:hypothetical protein